MLAVRTVQGKQRAVLGFVLTSYIAACSSVSSKRERALELDDVWTANGLPCAAEKVDLPLNLRKRSGQLTATSLVSKGCFAPGGALWQAKLPAKPIVAADLPLTLAAELTLEGAPPAGMLTLLSEARMILTTEHAVIEVTRGAELSGPTVGATPGEPAERGGTAGESAAQQPAAEAAAAGSESGAGAGEPPAAGAAGSGGAGRAAPAAPSAASGSGVAGSAAVPAAGASAGMPAPQAGSAAPVAGMAAPPAAGSGGAAGASATGMFPRTWDLDDLQTTFWYCVTLEGGCVCINNNKKGYDEDSCFLRPRGCCYVLLEIDEVNCQCHAANSARCMEEAQGPNVLHVDTCPPP